MYLNFVLFFFWYHSDSLVNGSFGCGTLILKSSQIAVQELILLMTFSPRADIVSIWRSTPIHFPDCRYCVEMPFKDDPFLKDKYKGGLRSSSSSLAGDMSEAARARERLSFEAAAEAMQKGKQGRGSKLSIPSSMDFVTGGVMQFTSSGAEVCLG